MTNCQGQPPLPPQGAQLTNLTPCLLAMPKAPIHTGRVLHKWWLLLFIFQCSLLFNEMLGFGGAHWVEECTPKWYNQVLASLVAQRLKRLPGMQETLVRSLGREDPLEKEMATHSSTIAWKISWREEPGRLQSMGSQRVRHDWATSLHFLAPSTYESFKYVLFAYDTIYIQWKSVYPQVSFRNKILPVKSPEFSPLISSV